MAAKTTQVQAAPVVSCQITGEDFIRLLKKSEMRVLQAILAVSVALNLMFGYNIHKLRLLIPPGAQAQQITGYRVGPINVHDSAGNLQIIDFTERPQPTVVYFFRPDCHWCARNLDNIRELYAEKQNEFRFIGLAREDPTLFTYVRTSGIQFPAYAAFALTRLDGLKVGSATPQTLVISQNGTVAKNWMGAFTDTTAAEIESYFKVKLPGLLPDTIK
jgi:peroxiredoxin